MLTNGSDIYELHIVLLFSQRV